MAQVDSSNNPNDPNNPNNVPGGVNQPGAAGTNQPATSGGGGPVTATGAANVTGQVVGTAAPAQPFQNISSYLTANADKSPQLAQQVAGTVSGPISKAGQDISNAATAFPQSVNAGYTPENSDVISAVAKNPMEAVQKGPQSISDFIANLSDAYTGPSNFTASPGYADLQTEVANANANAANTKTQPGIQALLKQTEGPTTQGINNLDALLLNMDPKNLATIQSSTNGVENLAPALANASTTGNASVAAAVAAAAKAKQDAQNAFSTATGNFSTGVNSELQNATAGYKGAQDNLNTLISGIAQPGLSGLTTRQLIDMGVDPAVFTAYSGLPTVTNEMNAAWANLPALGNAPGSTEWTFPTVGPAPTAANVATANDYATLAALTQLSGGQPFNSPIASDTASSAGSYAAQPLSPTPNNQALAQDLYNYLNGWSNVSGLKPVPTVTSGATSTSVADYAALMNQLAQYLGKPAFNSNFPTPPPPPTPTGPPFVGPPGGDVSGGGHSAK